MCKQFSFIAILLAALLLLTSCTTPVAAPSTTPIPSSNPVVTTIPIPASTPRTEPYTIEECETILEAITGTDVTYKFIAFPDDSYYHYINETHTYVMNRFNGTFAGYSKNTCDTSSQKVDIEDLEQIAIDEIKKYCPRLFDLIVEVEVQKNISNDKHQIYFYQLSPIHRRRTGNNANVTIHANGDIVAISIYSDEDPTIVDKPIKITKEQAINIAYKACQDYIEEIKQHSEKPDFDVFFDERDTHETTATLTVWKDRQMWKVNIKNIRNNRIDTNEPDHPPCVFATIDAKTGELLEVGGAF